LTQPDQLNAVLPFDEIGHELRQREGYAVDLGWIGLCHHGDAKSAPVPLQVVDLKVGGVMAVHEYMVACEQNKLMKVLVSRM
jgi:hypothetical protein